MCKMLKSLIFYAENHAIIRTKAVLNENPIIFPILS